MHSFKKLLFYLVFFTFKAPTCGALFAAATVNKNSKRINENCYSIVIPVGCIAAIFNCCQNMCVESWQIFCY